MTLTVVAKNALAAELSYAQTPTSKLYCTSTPKQAFTHLDKDLVVFQSLKVLLCHLYQIHISALVLSELELNMTPSVLQHDQ